MAAVIRLLDQFELLLDDSAFLVQRFQQVFFIQCVQLLQLALAHFHDAVVRLRDVSVFQHGGHGFIGQLHLVQCEVDLWLLDAFDEVLAVLGTLRPWELCDGLLAHRLGFPVVVEISAVAAVAFVLAHQVAGDQRSDLCRQWVVGMLGLETFQGSLVQVIFLEDAIDEAKTFEVVVNQHVFIALLEVIGNQFLIDLQALDERVVSVAQVDTCKLSGRQPPQVGVAVHIVGIRLFLIIVGYTVKHELED